MMRHLGLMDNVKDTNNHFMIHRYRTKVLARQPGHRPVGCRETDCQSWLCIKIVRSIVDRAISSYIHCTRFRKKIPFSTLETLAASRGINSSEASFELFLQSLHTSIRSKVVGYSDPHYMLQADTQCDSVEGMNLIPLEALTESLDLINQTRGVYLNASGLVSAHYISKSSNEKGEPDQKHNKNVSNLPFSQLFSPDGKFQFTYDEMFDKPAIKKLFCEIYCHDIELYVQMCQQPTIQTNEALSQVCERERQRLLTICQVDYFQQ